MRVSTERSVGAEPLSPGRAEHVLDGLMAGVTHSHARLDGRFPLYRSPGAEWVSSRRGSWTAGMWTGLLWLRALRSGRAEDVTAARETHRALRVWAEADTATRGLIFWYPLALSRLASVEGRDELEETAGRCARSLLGRFSAEHGVVPWGEAFGGPGDLVRVDGAPGVAPLMCRARGATPESARAGARHLHRHLRLCWDGRDLTPVLRWDEDAEPTRARAGYWSRGRAWLLTGFADALETGVVGPDDPALARLLDARAPLLPAADQREPGAGVDTGAAAIEAVALLRLARSLTDTASAGRLRRRARELVRILADEHLTEEGHGLTGGAYETHEGRLTGIESVWGDFFLALAVAMTAGTVPVAQP